MKLHNNIFSYLLLIALLFGAALDGSAQKPKPFKLKKGLPEGQRINSSGSSVVLTGDMQIGGHYVLSPIGWGAIGDFSYVLKSSILLEAAAGYFLESHNGVDISRLSIHAGGKYQLFDLKVISGYGGAGINVYVRNFSNLTTKSRPSTALWGPALFTEISIGILPKLGLALRAEQVFIFSEKVQTSEGSKEFYSLTNLSIGLRKIL